MSQSKKCSRHLNSRLGLAKRVRLQIDPISKEPVLQSQESIILLNTTGHEILSRCDGTRTQQALIEELGTKYPDSKAILELEVSQYIEQLDQKGLLEWI